MYQQLSPGQREEMSLLVAYPPLPSPPLAASTPAHSRRRRLGPEEPACSLQAAALRPLLLRNQPAETHAAVVAVSAPTQRVWATGEELCPRDLELH